MPDWVFSEDHFMLQYCPDRHKTQKMCRKAVDSCLSGLKFVPDWFVTDKMIKKLYETLFANIILFCEDFSKVIFWWYKWAFLV